MEKSKHLIILSALFFCLGALFLLIKREWLIIRWLPSYKRTSRSSSKKHAMRRKRVGLQYWKEEALKSEDESFLWSADNAENSKLVVGAWLSLLYEERVLPKKVGIQSAALAVSGQELFLSFDHLPFERSWSIQRKWRVLDGLCKTIAGAGLGVQTLVFLVNHEGMQDDHLDFSQPWPVDGF